jgi:hypothetical protein
MNKDTTLFITSIEDEEKYLFFCNTEIRKQCCKTSSLKRRFNKLACFVLGEPFQPNVLLGIRVGSCLHPSRVGSWSCRKGWPGTNTPAYLALNFMDEEEIEAFEALTRIAENSIKFGVNVQT